MIQIIQILSAITSNTLPKATVSSSMPSVLKIIFGLAGLLSVVFVAFGGLKYTLSAGDPTQVKQAKETILYAIIGLVLSLSAFILVSFVLGKLI